MTNPRNQIVVYLLHFDRPVGRSRHYLGSTTTKQLERRLRSHAGGYGARLTSRAAHANVTMRLVMLSVVPGRHIERKIKRAGHLARHCYLCNPSLPVPAEARILADADTYPEFPSCKAFAF